MYKIFKMMFIFTVIFGVYYAVDKYETKKITESLRDMVLISPNTLNKLSIVTYPGEKRYMSFDYQEVQDTYRALTKLEVKEAKGGQGTGSYMKIRFSEDGRESFIEYDVYSNAYITRAENAISVYNAFHSKGDEAEIKRLMDELLTSKVFE